MKFKRDLKNLKPNDIIGQLLDGGLQGRASREGDEGGEEKEKKEEGEEEDEQT